MSTSLFPEAIRTVLIDDEAVALQRLRRSLSLYPQITVIGEAKDGLAAVECINTLRPGLVFLDIQMPGLNGFEVLARLDYIPLVVFVTAYEAYAIKAFEENSLDYLLKPVEDQRLALTIKKIGQRTNGDEALLDKIRQLIGSQATGDIISTIPVRTGDTIRLVPVAEICFFEAKDKYVTVHVNNEEKLIDYSLQYLQERLPAGFVRVHRGFIVNKAKIREIRKHFKGTFILVMNDAKSSRIRTAVSYTDTIKTKLLLP